MPSDAIQTVDTLEEILPKLSDTEVKQLVDNFDGEYQQKLKEFKVIAGLQKHLMHKPECDAKYEELDSRRLKIKGALDCIGERLEKANGERIRRLQFDIASHHSP
jgi:hypothetical protein